MTKSVKIVFHVSLLIALYTACMDILILSINEKEILRLDVIFLAMVLGFIIEFLFFITASILYYLITFQFKGKRIVSSIIFGTTKLLLLYHNDGDAPILTENSFMFISYSFISFYFFYLLCKNLEVSFKEEVNQDKAL